MSVQWEPNEKQVERELEEMGIRFEPNDSWQNTNSGYYREKDNRASSVLSVFYFYGACVLIFGSVYVIGKWLIK